MSLHVFLRRDDPPSASPTRFCSSRCSLAGVSFAYFSVPSMSPRVLFVEIAFGRRLLHDYVRRDAHQSMSPSRIFRPVDVSSLTFSSRYSSVGVSFTQMTICQCLFTYFVVEMTVRRCLLHEWCVGMTVRSCFFMILFVEITVRRCFLHEIVVKMTVRRCLLHDVFCQDELPSASPSRSLSLR